MNARDLPYGAREIAELRSTGQRPADLVLISFLGPLPESNPLIVAQPSRSYDWRFLVGLHVAVVVKTDTPNVAGIVKAIEAAKPATLSVWFADKQDGVNVALQGYRPRTKSGRRMGIMQRVAWAGTGLLSAICLPMLSRSGSACSGVKPRRGRSFGAPDNGTNPVAASWFCSRG
jgi:hypothetical protein